MSKSLGRLFWEAHGTVLYGERGYPYGWDDIKPHDKEQMEAVAEVFAQAVLDRPAPAPVTPGQRTYAAWAACVWDSPGAPLPWEDLSEGDHANWESIASLGGEKRE